MFQWQRTHIIDELKHHQIEVETFNPLLFDSVEEANDALLLRAKQGKYDLFLSSTCYYKMLFVETLEEIKKVGIPTLTIAWDNLMVPYMDKVLAPHFDLVWLTARETTRLYKKWGANYFFAPYAANPYTYTYNQTSLKRSACFIGNPHGSRALMINSLTNGGVPVDLFFGRNKTINQDENVFKTNYDIVNPSRMETITNRFRFKEGRKLLLGSIINKFKGTTVVEDNPLLYRHPGLSHDEMVSAYSSAVLCLASTSAGHTDVLQSPLPIINLRNFEVPMCGGIEICKYNEELASYFEDGKEIIFYRTEEELVDKAHYYVERASDAEIITIKQAARKRAESDHTWWRRFESVFSSLGLQY